MNDIFDIILYNLWDICQAAYAMIEAGAHDITPYL